MNFKLTNFILIYLLTIYKNTFDIINARNYYLTILSCGLVVICDGKSETNKSVFKRQEKIIKNRKATKR